MLTRIHLKNFRAFRDTEIGPFNRVNLIAGLNNTGKTGLLEAIYLGLLPEGKLNGLPTLFRTFSQNADVNENFWSWLFKDRNRESNIVISVNDDQSGEEYVLLTTKGSPPDNSGLQFRRGENLGPLTAWWGPTGISSPPKVAVFSSHPSDPKQDAIDYNRVIA